MDLSPNLMFVSQDWIAFNKSNYRCLCIEAALHLASDRHTVLLFAEYAVRERQVRRDTVGHGSSGQIGRAHRYRQAKAGKDRC